MTPLIKVVGRAAPVVPVAVIVAAAIVPSMLVVAAVIGPPVVGVASVDRASVVTPVRSAAPVVPVSVVIAATIIPGMLVVAAVVGPPVVRVATIATVLRKGSDEAGEESGGGKEGSRELHFWILFGFESGDQRSAFQKKTDWCSCFCWWD